MQGFFRVDGADLETGEETYLVLQAPSSQEAEEIARKQGLLIASVRVASSEDWGVTPSVPSNVQNNAPLIEFEASVSHDAGAADPLQIEPAFKTAEPLSLDAPYSEALSAQEFFLNPPSFPPPILAFDESQPLLEILPPVSESHVEIPRESSLPLIVEPILESQQAPSSQKTVAIPEPTFGDSGLKSEAQPEPELQHAVPESKATAAHRDKAPLQNTCRMNRRPARSQSP